MSVKTSPQIVTIAWEDRHISAVGNCEWWYVLFLMYSVCSICLGVKCIVFVPSGVLCVRPVEVLKLALDA